MSVGCGAVSGSPLGRPQISIYFFCSMPRRRETSMALTVARFASNLGLAVELITARYVTSPCSLCLTVAAIPHCAGHQLLARLSNQCAFVACHRCAVCVPQLGYTKTNRVLHTPNNPARRCYTRWLWMSARCVQIPMFSVWIIAALCSLNAASHHHVDLESLLAL